MVKIKRKQDKTWPVTENDCHHTEPIELINRRA